MPEDPNVDIKLTTLLSFHCMKSNSLNGPYFRSKAPLSAVFVMLKTELSHPLRFRLVMPQDLIWYLSRSRIANSVHWYLLSMNTHRIPSGSITMFDLITELMTAFCVVLGVAGCLLWNVNIGCVTCYVLVRCRRGQCRFHGSSSPTPEQMISLTLYSNN